MGLWRLRMWLRAVAATRRDGDEIRGGEGVVMRVAVVVTLALAWARWFA